MKKKENEMLDGEVQSLVSLGCDVEWKVVLV